MRMHNRDLCMHRDLISLLLRLVKQTCTRTRREWDTLLLRMNEHIRAHFRDWGILKGKCKSGGLTAILKKKSEEPEVSRSSKYDIIEAMRFMLVLLVRSAHRLPLSPSLTCPYRHDSFTSFCLPRAPSRYLMAF